MRRVFPEEAGRIVFSSNGFGTSLRSATGVEFVVYADAACTIPADIVTLDQQPIVDSAITVDNDSLLPLFLGPDGAEELWARQQGGAGTISLLFPRPALPDDVLSSLAFAEVVTPTTPPDGELVCFVGVDHLLHTLDALGRVGSPKGFVNHGANGTVPRPLGYESIEWSGSVAPSNAAAGDTWVVTT